MQLPGPLDEVASVDLMMSVAAKLSKKLGGSICDERRNKINTRAMVRLRSRAAEFARLRAQPSSK
jgi:FtsZ-interacting cell division protein ZipA